jgi:hypothetical protein
MKDFPQQLETIILVLLIGEIYEACFEITLHGMVL